MKAEVPALRAAHPEAAALTDDEIIALRGYVGDVRKPEFGGGRDFERINRALRDEDHQQLEILKEYIDQLKSGLSKMPQHKGRVSRMLPNEDEAFVRKEFVEGKTWTDRGFMSTSEGEALDKSWVMISFSDTKSGRKVGALQVFSEREVVFPPGVKFEVQRVIELPPGASSRFLIFLREL